MWEKQIKSKVYIKKRPNTALIVVLSICVIIMSIIGVISIISDGLNVGNISPIIIALAVGISALNKSKEKDEYIFDIATITINDLLEVTYNESQLKVVFEISRITMLQYSDQLKCLRIVGDFTKTYKKKTEPFTNNEFLLYVGDGEEVALINELENNSQLKTQYMDR